MIVATEKEVGSKASRFKSCPKGTTIAWKVLLKGALMAAKNKISQTYFEAKSQASNDERRIKDGWPKKVLNDMKER